MINEQNRLDATKPMFMVTTDEELWEEFNEVITIMNGLKSTFQNNGVTLSFEQSAHVYAMFTEIGNKLIQLEQSSMKHLVHLKGDEKIVNGVVHTVRGQERLVKPESSTTISQDRQEDPDKYRIKPSPFDNDHGIQF